MRQRERIVRVAAEIAEKSGLDPRSKEAIDSVLPHIDKKSLPVEILDKKTLQVDTKERIENQEEAAKDLPAKKKNPFPPKKKKSSDASEEKTSVVSTDE